MDIFSIERKEGNFVMTYRVPFQDKSLSLKARGLLATIMAFPPNWEFSVKGLTKILKEGKSAIYTSINELIESGYCKREDKRGEEGKMEGVEYTFADYPKFAPTQADNPLTENRYTENQPQYNILNKKIDIKEEVERKRKLFREKVAIYIPQYGEKMINNFCSYWCEADGMKLRCEIAKAKTGCFEISRRLETWAKKEYNRPKPTRPIWEEMGVTEEYYKETILKNEK